MGPGLSAADIILLIETTLNKTVSLVIMLAILFVKSFMGLICFILAFLGHFHIVSLASAIYKYAAS